MKNLSQYFLLVALTLYFFKEQIAGPPPTPIVTEPIKEMPDSVSTDSLQTEFVTDF